MNRLEVRVASTHEDIQRVFAIRSAVFMAEQLCPYDEEFDGNDYCATHLLGFAKDEPAAVMRVRYFASFAKFERLAVLPRFRKTAAARGLIEAAIEICRRKGYTNLYAQAQKRLVGFWGKFGFEPLYKNTRLVFSDHEYVEIGAKLIPHGDPITHLSDPYLIIRPEGRWDQPGVLEKSAERPATNPH
jgi:predicted GNAT family N-acyltransferase